jgi:uncharacterized repeat protein (TIGR01451 family)
MPALVAALPQNATDLHYVKILSLAAGETVSLNWNWNLPLSTGNIVQGDGLSLDINYLLEQIVPPTTTPPPSTTPPPPSTTTESPQPMAGVAIVKTGPSSVSTGFSGSYTLAVTNIGEVALHEVTVIDYLPDFLIYQDSTPTGTTDGNKITWNLGTLNIGNTRKIVVVLGGVKPGAGVDRANVVTSEGVTSSDSLHIEVTNVPLPLITVGDSSDPDAVGSQFVYTIKVINPGAGMALHNVIISARIPAELTYAGADGPTLPAVSGTTIHFGPLAELKPGETGRGPRLGTRDLSRNGAIRRNGELG